MTLLWTALVVFGQEQSGEEPPPEAPVFFGAPRWFRSNAGGMMLEEVAVSTTALRGEYALLLEYLDPGALPDILAPFYRAGYSVEKHTLYANGAESRRQWIFRDSKRTARLVAAFYPDWGRPKPAETESPPADPAGEESLPPEETGETGTPVASTPDPYDGRGAPAGFIEIYNENYLITSEYLFFDAGEEAVIFYFYNRGLMYRATARWRFMVNGRELFTDIYTDNYRYNRSGSLRSVERVFHDQADVLPATLAFPNRVLDAAQGTDFIGDRLPLGSEFFGNITVAEGYRMVFTTDQRGRILTQTLLDPNDTEVWVIQNTWSGDRIVSALKTEGDDKKLIQYEYNSRGSRILERNVHNGVLERLVRAEGSREIEELYMRGEVILRAVWENGRKISEDRIRNR